MIRKETSVEILNECCQSLRLIQQNLNVLNYSHDIGYRQNSMVLVALIYLNELKQVMEEIGKGIGGDYYDV